MSRMDVLVLSAEDVTRLLPMRDCIRVMREALAALARGNAELPLRLILRLPDRSGFLGVMPGWIGPDGPSGAALGMKAVAVFPGNASRGIDTHQGAVLLFEADTGRLSALIDGAAITAIRTAAVSAVATDVLARKESARLAVLGAGVQAGTHLEAVAAVRSVTMARVWSRNPAHAERLVRDANKAFDFVLEVAPSAEAAVREADIVVTVTASREPIVQRSWLAPGTHINAVGSSTPTARELDTETVRAARLFVDRREAALHEAGDILIPITEGAFPPDHILAELGEVVIGRHPGRQSREEITLFKSLGLAVEDVASAAFIARQAQATGVGKTVSL